jgi:hypothetical protein
MWRPAPSCRRGGWLDDLADGLGGDLEHGLLLVAELHLDDLLDAVLAEDAGDAEEEVGVAVLAAQQGGAGQHALAVADDRLDHGDGGGGGGVVAGVAEQADDLAAAVAGALDDGVDLVLREQLGERDAGDRGVGRQRDHGVAVAAEDHAVDVVDADAEGLGDEGLVAGGVEDAGHADDALLGELRLLVHDVAHGIQRVADADEHGVRGAAGDLAGDAADDLAVDLDELVARGELAGDGVLLARDAGGDDDDVGVGGLVVAVGADELEVEAHDRRRLGEVEGLALRKARDDVDEDDVPEVLLGGPVGGGRPDVAGPHDRDLVAA